MKKQISIFMGVILLTMLMIGGVSAVGDCSGVSTATINTPTGGSYYHGWINTLWTPDGTYSTCVFDVEYQKNGDIGWTSIGSTDPGSTSYNWSTSVATTSRGDANDFKFRVKLGAAELSKTNAFTLDNTNPTISILDDASGVWTNSDTISVTVNDATSGVKETIWVVKENNTCDASVDFSNGTIETGTPVVSVVANNQEVYQNKYICFRVEDNAGNKNYAVSSQITWLDTTAPVGGDLTWSTVNHPESNVVSQVGNLYTVTPALTGTDVFTSLSLIVTDNNLNTINSVPVYIDGEITANGYMAYVEDVWSYVPGTPVIFSEGEHNLVSTFLDNAGNTVMLTARFTTDKTAPTTSGAITSGTLGNNDWYTTNVDYTITPSDATSGVASTVYCTDATDDCVPATPLGAITLSTEGDNYVRFSSTDNAGNVQNVQSSGLIKIDKTAPSSPTISYTSGGETYNPLGFWSNLDVIFTIANGEDTISGVSKSQYRLTKLEIGSWTDYSGPVTISDDGTTIVQARTVNNAGLISSETGLEYAMVDKTAPTISINSPAVSSWQKADFNIENAESDATSGLLTCEIKILDKSVESLAWTVIPCNVAYSLDISAHCITEGADKCEAQLKATDLALNTAVAVTRKFSIDIVAPTISGEITSRTPGDNLWYITDVEYTITPSDATSGVASTVYCTDATDDCVPATPLGAITLSTEGDNYVRFSSTDNAGNVQNVQSSGLIKIDKTAPLVNASLDQIKNAQFIQDATTSDAISGIYSWLWTSDPEAITFDLNNEEDTTISANVDGEYIIRLTVTDNAGNSAFDEFTLTWDTVSPNNQGPEVNPNPVIQGGTAIFTGTVSDTNILQGAQVHVFYDGHEIFNSLTNAADGAFDEAIEDVVLEISAATTLSWTSGTYVFWFEGQDGAGNWQGQTDANTDTFTVAESSIYYTKEEIEAKITHLEGEIGANTAAISALDTRVTGTETSITTLNTNVAANTASINTLNNQVSTLQSDATALGSRVTVTEGDIVTLKSDVASLQTSVATLNTNVAANTASINTLNTNVAANTASINTLNNQVSTLQASVNDNAEDITTLQGLVSGLGGDVSDLEDRLGIAETTIGALQFDLGVVQNDVANLQDDLGVVQNDVANLQDDLGVVQNDVANLQDDLWDLEDDLANLFSFVITDATSDNWNNFEGTLEIQTSMDAVCTWVDELNSDNNGFFENGDGTYFADVLVSGEGINLFTATCTATSSNYGFEYTKDKIIAFTVDTAGSYGYTEWLGPSTWDSFFLPKIILSLLGINDFSVMNILSSIEGSFDEIYYYDGVWKSCAYDSGSGQCFGTLTELTDEENKPYWIKMNQKDRLEISSPHPEA